MGAMAEAFRVPNNKQFGDRADTDYERAIQQAEREGRPPIREITGGQMPVDGCIQSQHQHQDNEIRRLIGLVNRLREERDVANFKLRELNVRLQALHEQWEACCVKEKDGELVRTV